ncbi:MAG: hypothetical protein ACREC5_02725, partial [Thermoplasmata archaeon]
AANLSGPGPASWPWRPDRAGSTVISVEVSDALGRIVEENLTVLVTPAATPSEPTTGDPPVSGTDPPIAPPAPTPVPVAPLPGNASPAGPNLAAEFVGGFGAATGLGLMVLLGWVLLRGRLGRRLRPSDRSGPELNTVGRLLRENGGVDRETLLFLAEGEGLEEKAVDRALARLTAGGRLRTEVDSDGLDCYRLLAPTRPAEPEGPTPESTDPDGERP